MVHPMTVAWREVAVTLVFACPSRHGFIERRRGALLLVLHVVYLGAILQSPVA